MIYWYGNEYGTTPGQVWERGAQQHADTTPMSTTPDILTPRDSTPTGVFADASGYLSAVEVHDPAAKHDASWSGGIYL